MVGSLALNFTYHVRILTLIQKKCPNVSPKVKQEMRQLLDKKNKEKVKKATDIEEIRAELRGTMRGRNRHLIDDNEEGGSRGGCIYVSE